MKTIKTLAIVAIFGLGLASASSTFACDKNGKCSTGSKKASSEKSTSKTETKTATKTTEKTQNNK